MVFTGGHGLQGSEVGNKAIAHSCGDMRVCLRLSVCALAVCLCAREAEREQPLSY